MIDVPMPTDSGIALRPGNFGTVCDGLDYAALGESGHSYYSVKGLCLKTLSYRALRSEAMKLAGRLANVYPRNARIGLLAATCPEFVIVFFACQYAGLVPVPMPPPTTLGGRKSYERQLRQMAETADTTAFFAPSDLTGTIRSALDGLQIPILDMSEPDLPTASVPLTPHGPDDLCYIQYSSGSTSAPKGVINKQSTVAANCEGIIRHGMHVRSGDRAVSWLPLYHDMGLIGFLIAPMMSQLSVDFIEPSSFARRPTTWLSLISQNRGTLSYSPSFGYELCVRRWRADRELDLSSWRVAGIGGDMVRESSLAVFSETFSPYGFRSEAFVASYGLAEATLAVAFAPLDRGIRVDHVDADSLRSGNFAVPASDTTNPNSKGTFVTCGRVLAGHEVEIRRDGHALAADREIGQICVRGPSVTEGYFRNSEATQLTLVAGGWLETGDLGYWLDGELFVTGRSKDVILWHGRKIWPQDIEWMAEMSGGKRVARSAAFSIATDTENQKILLLAECRSREPEVLRDLDERITDAVRTGIGAPVHVLLVPPSSLIFTSSGKLSRAGVRSKYLDGGIENLRVADLGSVR